MGRATSSESIAEDSSLYNCHSKNRKSRIRYHSLATIESGNVGRTLKEKKSEKQKAPQVKKLCAANFIS
jgi:hypothetical protein